MGRHLQKTCGICLKTMRGDTLTRHMKHHEKKPYSIDVVTGEIEYHSTAGDVARNKYKCRYCAYSSNRSFNLRKHEKSVQVVRKVLP